MVCAPSNAALDEIITRIAKFGLLDEKGLDYSFYTLLESK